MHRSSSVPMLTFIAALACLSAAAADDSCPHPPRPPQAAFDACTDLQEGDACTVTLRDREIEGTCAKLPDQQGLACRPNGFPQQPPPQ